MSNCRYCGRPLKGRADKKYCDDACRNSFNNEKNSNSNNFIRQINNQLRKNRRVLSDALGKNEETKKITRDSLLKKGFNFKHFTHIYTTKKGQQYNFVYEFGYLDLGEDWFLIVKRDIE